MVAEVLKKSANLSSIGVNRVIRLPMHASSSLKSLVLVELDTVEHENAVIKGKSGDNFTNVLLTAFALVDPKGVKRY